MIATPALAVRDLRVRYAAARADVAAVRGVSLEVWPAEIFGIAGESGSGKTTLALAALRLLPPPARIEAGRVELEGRDLLALPEPALRSLRWTRIALVPQGSMSALNPVLRIEEQIRDAIDAHERNGSPRAMRVRVADALEAVRLPPRVARMYPHELSGGMRQRACIAMAIVLSPRVLIADEPTSALDVVAQRAVAETLLEARERLGAALVLIGHDLALHAQLVDRLAIMRRGRLVELGPVREVFHAPAHPYTRVLLDAARSPATRGLVRFAAEAGGCPGGGRCDGTGAEAMHEITPGHLVACEARADDA